MRTLVAILGLIVAALLCLVLVAAPRPAVRLAVGGEWNQDEDPPYNIGDLVRYPDVARRRLPHLRRKFPRSIAVEYVEATERSFDWKVLVDIVRQRDAPASTPAVAVHLRTGDVIDNSRYTVEEHLEAQRVYKNGVVYVRPRSYFADVIRRLKALGLETQVTCFTGFHHGGRSDHAKSYRYIDAVAVLFEAAGFAVALEIDGDPDMDLLQMVHADVFVPTAGGYSSLICELRKRMRRDDTFCQ